jgi:MFS family permease
MNRLAVGWFVLDQTDSALLTTIAYTAQSAPGLLVAPFGGAIADRVDRRKLLAGAATVESVVAAALAIVAIDGIESVWPVVMLVGLTGIVNSMKTPATQALIPDTVGVNDAMNGIAIHSVGIRGIGVLGALSSGMLLEIYGPVTVFSVASMLYLLAAVAFVRVNVRPRVVDSEAAITTVMQDTREGLKLLFSLPTVRSLLTMAVLIEILCFSFRSVLPVVARDRLGLDESGLGALTGMAGFGSLLGALLLVALSDYGKKGRLLIFVAGVYGSGILLLGASEVQWFSFVVIAVVGLAAALFDALQWGLLQGNVPDEMRGRAVGGWTFAVGFGWIGHLGLGAMSDAFGVQWAVGMAGLLAVTVAIVAYATSRSLKAA